MPRANSFDAPLELLNWAGDPRELLESCARQMRRSRGLPAGCQNPCQRVAALPHKLDDLLADDDALGQIYQALNQPRLRAAYRATTTHGRKFTAREIPAVTQLFTPRWVVEFLLQNSLGQFWRELHPDSGIALPWLGEPSRARDVAAKRCSAIRVLDPACGTMNFGLVAVEMLSAMYLEEMDRAGRPGWPAEPSVRSSRRIPKSILRHNLFGIDIDPLTLDLARATLEMKLGLVPDALPMHLVQGDALFLDVDSAGFDVVVTNPPYLSARNLSRSRVSRLKRHFPRSWRDECTCFLERCVDSCQSDGGRVGILAMQSFMFTAGFQRLREHLANHCAIESIAHFGGGLFENGNPGTLQTAAIVLRRESDAVARSGQTVNTFRLVDSSDKHDALKNRFNGSRIIQSQLLDSPRAGWIYWLSPAQRRAFASFPRLREIAPPRQGLATTDNAQFVRYWWEIEPTTPEAPCRSSADTWFPYAKGGRFRRWHESPRHRVNWREDGADIKQNIVERYPYLRGKWQWVAKNSSYYGKAGVTYSYLTSGRFSARLLPAGALFDVAGSSLFPEHALTLLGILNARVAADLMHAINPTVNFQVGDLRELPIPCERDEELESLVARAVEIQRELDSFDETAPDFVAPMPWQGARGRFESLHASLADVEARIDRRAAELYDLTFEPPRAAIAAFDAVELARRWASFELRILARSWPQPFIQFSPVDERFVSAIRDGLSDAAREIDAALGGLDRFFAREFVSWHVQLYHRRPTCWPLRASRELFVVPHDRATCEVIEEIGCAVPRCWQRRVDDGIHVNLAPLHEIVADRALARELNEVAKDLQGQRLSWSQTAQDVEGCSTPAY